MRASRVLERFGSGARVGMGYGFGKWPLPEGERPAPPAPAVRAPEPDAGSPADGDRAAALARAQVALRELGDDWLAELVAGARYRLIRRGSDLPKPRPVTPVSPSCHLDRHTRELVTDGRVRRLTPAVAALLAALVAGRGRWVPFELLARSAGVKRERVSYYACEVRRSFAVLGVADVRVETRNLTGYRLVPAEGGRDLHVA